MEPRIQDPRPSTSRCSFDSDLDHRFSNLTKWPGMSVEGFHHEGQLRSPGVHSTAELVYEPQPPKRQTTGPLQRIKLMFTRFPWRDMSYMTGVLFAIGSAFFVVNGFFLVLPLTNPSTVFAGQLYWTGSTAVIGGVIFILGGFAAVLEALNLNRGGSEEVIEGVVAYGDVFNLEFKNSDELPPCHNPPTNTKLVAPFRDSTQDFPLRQLQTSPHLSANSSTQNTSNTSSTTKPPSTTATLPALYGSPSFIFWPPPELRAFYFRDLCFIASLIQSIGTFIFLFAIITAFPLVLDLTNLTNLYVLNLFPATLGGVLFITASVLQTICTQEKWYKPHFKGVDWWVGAWNVVGSIGFMLAGALFFLGTTEGGLQGSLASLWGSWAFMVGAILQWYVAMGNCR